MILLDDRMGLTSNREMLIYSLNAPICGNRSEFSLHALNAGKFGGGL